MTWTDPSTWPTSELVTAAALNEQVRDNTAFLRAPPSCRVYRSTSQSIANTTFTAISLDAERFDNASLHSTSVNTSRVTFTEPGLYLLSGYIEWTANATGLRHLGIALSATTWLACQEHSAGSTISCGLSLSTVYKFAAAEWISLMVYQSSGGALNCTVAELSATWVGTGA